MREIDSDDQGLETAALIARATRGDRAAFGALYEADVGAVYSFACRMLGDVARAEDVTAETFARVLAALPRFRAESYRGWLFTIAHHVIVDECRRAARFRPDVDISQRVANGPESIVLARLDGERLCAGLASLTPDQREVIALRLAGLSAVEIASAMGKTRNAIDALQLRAVNRLRRYLAS